MQRLPLTFRLTSALLLAAILLLALHQAADAQSPFSSLYWDFIDVTIDVQENGDMLVTETQTYVYDTFTPPARYRYIPLDDVDYIKDIHVSRNGQPLQIHAPVEDGRQWIQWIDEEIFDWAETRNGSRDLEDFPKGATFRIHYRVVGGLQQDRSDAKLDWEALFPNRGGEIRKGRVTVSLPQHLAGQVGKYSSSGAPATTQQTDGRTVEFNTVRALSPGEDLIVKVSFPGDSFPANSLRGSAFVGSPPFIYLLISLASVAGTGLLGLLALQLVKTRRARDAAPASPFGVSAAYISGGPPDTPQTTLQNSLAAFVKTDPGWTKNWLTGTAIAVLSFLYIFIGYLWDFKSLTTIIACTGMLALLIGFRVHQKETDLANFADMPLLIGIAVLAIFIGALVSWWTLLVVLIIVAALSKGRDENRSEWFGGAGGGGGGGGG